MYLVKLYKDHTDNLGVVIHSPYVSDAKLSSGQINYVLGSVSDFDFTVNIKSPAWNRIEPLKTIITVTDVIQNKIVFEGRALQPRSKMNPDGSFSKQVTCESLLAYLVDSTQRHAEIHDTTIAEFLQIIINNHNSQVEPHKQVRLGRVTVTNTTDNVYRYLGYENTYETIKDKLVDRVGGYIQLRREDGLLYLDYLEEVGEYEELTPIKLAHNMQSVDYEVDPTEIITRLVPLGESLDSEDEEATDASQARLTIESVNNGNDYIDDLELQAEFGIIERSVTWNDVTTPQRLLTNGRNFFRDQKAAIARISVNSTNSYLLGKDIASFEIGNYHDLINPVVDLDERVQIIEKKIDINQPQKSSLKIGEKFRTLTEYQKGMRNTRKQVVELESRMDGQRKTIATIRNEVVNVETNLGELQQVIADADLEELPGAVSALEQAIGDLNDALDGIPIYGTATYDTDGLQASTDKIDHDLMKTKMDLITIINPINLDQLYQDVQNLKNS